MQCNFNRHHPDPWLMARDAEITGNTPSTAAGTNAHLKPSIGDKQNRRRDWRDARTAYCAEIRMCCRRDKSDRLLLPQILECLWAC